MPRTVPIAGASLARAAECVVIGGGVMGCAVALRLAQAGVDVVVLERAVPGAEASSAAAGILAAQEEALAPGPLADLALASRARFAALADELRATTGIDIAYRAVGVTSLAADAASLAALRVRYAWQAERGLRVAWLDRAGLAELEPALAPDWLGGVHFADDHQLDPRPYVRALAQAAAQAGARFLTGQVVQGIDAHAGRVTGVRLDAGVIATRTVVVAAGSWSSLVPGVGLPPQTVTPLKGQIALLETRPPLVRGTIVLPGGYLVGRADGRVLVGSTMEPVGFDRRVTAGGLAHVLDLAIAAVPALADAPIVETWANFRPTTIDQLPILGPGPIDGLVLATGHFRHGILLSPITAEITRDLVVNGAVNGAVSGGASHPKDTDLAPFAWSRLGGATA